MCATRCNSGSAEDRRINSGPWLRLNRRSAAYELTWHIPVVAFTAHMTPEAIARASAAGCAAVITKPFEINTLLETIATALNPSTTALRERVAGRH